MWDAEIALLRADLEISSALTIIWVFAPAASLSKRRKNAHLGEATGLHLGKKWKIRVAADVEYRELVNTLAHELRHVKQWEAGWVTDRPIWTWLGSGYAPAQVWTKLPYTEQPHEIDAFAYAEDAWERLFAGREETSRKVARDLILEALWEYA